jgi:hypothetical protein
MHFSNEKVSASCRWFFTFASTINHTSMKLLLLFLATISLTSCFTNSSRIYDSDYTQTNRELVYNHLLKNSKAIPNAKLLKETLDSSSYKLEYGQNENCSGFVIVSPYRAHELKVTINYGCVDFKHKNATRVEFLNELGGVLH